MSMSSTNDTNAREDGRHSREPHSCWNRLSHSLTPQRRFCRLALRAVRPSLRSYIAIALSVTMFAASIPPVSTSASTAASTSTSSQVGVGKVSLLPLASIPNNSSGPLLTQTAYDSASSLARNLPAIPQPGGWGSFTSNLQETGAKTFRRIPQPGGWGSFTPAYETGWRPTLAST